MVSLRFRGEAFQIEGEETVLECLERNGISRPSSCRSGHCQVCTMKCTSGKIPANSQIGLGPTQRKLGAFLPCVCRPEEDLSLEASDLSIVATTVHSHEMVAADIAQIRIARPAAMEVLPGQFIHICKSEETVRSYSVANRADSDGFLEVHVRAISNGAVSPWLVQDIRAGDAISIRGPFGSCFYTDDAPDKTLILAGTSTGLAPLLGVLREALAQGHRGAIELYHGATSPDGLYLRDTLRELAQEHEQVAVFWSALQDSDRAAEVSDRPIGKWIESRHPKGKDLRAYVCGAPAFVQQIKRGLFLAGTPLPEILSDPFVG